MRLIYTVLMLSFYSFCLAQSGNVSLFIFEKGKVSKIIYEVIDEVTVIEHNPNKKGGEFQFTKDGKLIYKETKKKVKPLTGFALKNYKRLKLQLKSNQAIYRRI